MASLLKSLRMNLIIYFLTKFHKICIQQDLLALPVSPYRILKWFSKAPIELEDKFHFFQRKSAGENLYKGVNV